MKEQEIRDLLEELKLSKTGIGWTIKGDEALVTIEKVLRKHLGESKTMRNIAILESKIFVYEEIISKSNFAPIIKKVKNKTNTAA
jgi:hypothetical protein